MDFQDLSSGVESFGAKDAVERAALVDRVRVVHDRSSAVIDTLLRACRDEAGDQRLFFINGDHNHMTAAVSGFVRATRSADGEDNMELPIVVSIDLHSDARPPVDGPHSGTWCAEVCCDLLGVLLIGDEVNASAPQLQQKPINQVRL